MEEKKSFKLPTDRVVVKFIPRKKGMAAHVEKNHIISGGMLDRSFRRYSAPLTRQGSIANILTNAEKEYLEEVTGTKLSVYDKFWETFYVTLFKEDSNNVFDLSRPLDYISIKILEKYDDEVATTWEDRNKRSTYMFVITRENEELSEKKKGYDAKKEAFKAYGRIESDHEKLVGLLKLLTNKPIAKSSPVEWTQTKIEEFLDTNPERFLELIKDDSLETRLLIEKGLDAKIILKKSNKYSTVDGLELCKNGESPSYENAVRYLDDPRNQEVRSLIEAKINSNE